MKQKKTNKIHQYKRLGTKLAIRPLLTDKAQMAPLQSCIGDVERRVDISLKDLMSRLICLKQAKNSSDSSSDEEKGVSREKIRAPREKVRALRRANAGYAIVKYRNNYEPQSTYLRVVSPVLDKIKPARDTTFFSKSSTVDQEDEARALRASRAPLCPEA